MQRKRPRYEGKTDRSFEYMEGVIDGEVLGLWVDVIIEYSWGRRANYMD